MEAEIVKRMRMPVHQDLPAGLIDDDVEIFTTGDEVFALLNRNGTEFHEWPKWLKRALRKDLQADRVAVQELLDLGLETDDEMLWQYARCRYGSFDGRPDLKDGKFIHTEYWDCGIRGNCPSEGKLCCSMKMGDQVISRREMQAWRLVTQGYTDKEIAAELHVSVLTVPQHVRNLCKKCKVRHRGELIRLGVQLNIS